MATKKQVKEARAILEGVGLMLKGGRSVSGETVIKRAGGLAHEFFIQVEQFGSRAWLVVGKKKILLVWDNGNGWYQIIKELE